MEIQKIEKIYSSKNSTIWRGLFEGRPAIIKCVHIPEYSISENIKFAHKEFNLTKKMKSPYTTSPIEFTQTEDGQTIIFEDSNCDSVTKLITESPDWAKENIQALFTEMIAALNELHKKSILHLDVNPQNFIASKDLSKLQIIDLGLATEVLNQSANIKSVDNIQGSLPYIAPEQTGRMNNPIDFRSDYYSLGISWYEILFGSKPFTGERTIDFVHAHLAQDLPKPQLNSEVEKKLYSIIAKLCSKEPDERYQTFEGITSDLAQAFQDSVIANDFKPGLSDHSGRFNFKSKLYGRDNQLEEVKESIRRIALGDKHFLSIGGLSGIGKSALIKSAFKELSENNVWLTSGKFDLNNKLTPYSAFATITSQLVDLMLMLPDDELKHYKKRLSDLQDKLFDIVEIEPRITNIVSLPNHENKEMDSSQSRFIIALTDFVKSIACKETPIVLFFDDMQWADSGSLELIEYMARDPELKFIQVILSYRTNEVPEGHPFQIILDSIHEIELLKSIKLNFLKKQDVLELLAEHMYRHASHLDELADVVLDKTEGNPFFIREFLRNLVDESIISFNLKDLHWDFDIQGVRNFTSSGNIIELLEKRLRNTNKITNKLLAYAARIGAESKTIDIISSSDLDEAQAASAVKESTSKGFLWIKNLSGDATLVDETTINDFKIIFVHDRIQQESINLISNEESIKFHKQYALHLKKKGLEDDKNLFQFIEHFYLALNNLTTEENDFLRVFTIKGANRAVSSGSHAAALKYCLFYEKSLEARQSSSDFKRTKEEIKSFDLIKAKALLNNSKYNELTSHINAAVKNVEKWDDLANLRYIEIDMYCSQNRTQDVINTGRNILKKCNIHIPKKVRPYHVIWGLLRHVVFSSKVLDNVGEVSVSRDPNEYLTAQIMMKLATAAYYSDPNLFPYIVFTLKKRVDRYGVTDFGMQGITGVGILQFGLLNRYETGYGIILKAEKITLKHQLNMQVTTCHQIGAQFKAHFENFDYVEKICLKYYQVGLTYGDFEWACYSIILRIHLQFMRGAPLKKTYEDAVSFLRITLSLKQSISEHLLEQYLQSIYNLCHNVEDPTNMNGIHMDYNTVNEEREKEKESTALANTFFSKGMLCVFFAKDKEAILAFENMNKWINGLLFMVQKQFRFTYLTIAYVRLAKSSHGIKKVYYRLKAKSAMKKISKVASLGTTLEGYANLAKACYLSLKNNHKLTKSTFNNAKECLSVAGHVSAGALTRELYSDYLLEIGEKGLAKKEFLEAVIEYEKWQATSKIQHLSKKRPEWIEADNHIATSDHRKSLSSSTTTHASNKELDLESILSANQIISKEIEVERLMQAFLKTIIANAGAESATFITTNGEDHKIIARQEIDKAPEFQEVLIEDNKKHPLNIVRLAIRSKQQFIANDALYEDSSKGDPYVIENKAKSIMCLPLVSKNNVTAILFLENRATTNAFTEDRVRIIEALGTQANISLENAKLFEEVKDLNLNLEEKIKERTAELEAAQKEIVNQAHQAGMAEIAVGILHNVGNILNSVSTSSGIIRRLFNKDSSVSKIKQGLKLLSDQENPDEFIANDPKGKKLIQYFKKVEKNLVSQVDDTVSEISRLDKNLESIKTIISQQQEHAHGHQLVEELDLNDLIKYFLTTVESLISKSKIRISTKLEPNLPKLKIQKSKLMHILMNLAKNSIESIDEACIKGITEKRHLTISSIREENQIILKMIDSGIGVDSSSLNDIFTSGYTTKEKGNGIGLHSCANYMTEMNGRMEVHSDGIGHGAEFILKFPITVEKKAVA